ncbi:ClpP family protease [Lachnoclostridium phytofermentans]|uniref:Peptidase S14 ClpP n=1 Tax=Lachnoclostridium phytofermentans (strain ATCC 700394 / DSM 18823 / ISDg) TaxID=357809 RepID=A9KNK2_LACP7|nr:ATP-dependent Clp protease proteolytic subunit [Lachnoclostridium phytofermentans]ABX43119.1 peptidase S14 ClpP [Lachnoclostridium phytofermentans ISDg]
MSDVNFILYDSEQKIQAENNESVKDTVNMNSVKESSIEMLSAENQEVTNKELVKETPLKDDANNTQKKSPTGDKQVKGNIKKEKLEEENLKNENEKLKGQKIQDYGQATLEDNGKNHKIHLLSIIGEIEGHECLSQNAKTTKYEHVLPQLATIEDDTETDGLLILINTVGGDVSCGLALAEMIASLSKPTVSLVIGDSHSIGVPLAVATNYSFIVPTGTMIVHPVRMSGMVIGAPQTYDYFKLIQDRIVGFVSSHSKIKKEKLEQLMLNTGMLSKDLGTILVGDEAVAEGIINEVGGIKQAIEKLHQMIEEKNSNR